MTTGKFEFGDRVRNTKKPEWGIGTVLKTETIATNGNQIQSVTARFQSVGVKTLSTSHAPLEKVADDEQTAAAEDDVPTVEMWDRLNESGWLGEHARRKIDEIMTGLPMEARDAFCSIRSRLLATINLYRFDRSGRGLIDWAVAQSGLNDPLSRFSRSELEQIFDRWARKRDEHLAALIAEADNENMVEELLAQGPAAAKKAAQKARALR